MTLRDAEFVNGRKMNRTGVFGVFGVPPLLLNRRMCAKLLIGHTITLEELAREIRAWSSPCPVEIWFVRDNDWADETMWSYAGFYRWAMDGGGYPWSSDVAVQFKANFKRFRLQAWLKNGEPSLEPLDAPRFTQILGIWFETDDGIGRKVVGDWSKYTEAVRRDSPGIVKKQERR